VEDRPVMAARPAAPTPWRLAFDRPAQFQAGLLGVVFVAVFWHLLDFVPPQLGELTYAWVHELDWSHGPLIPLFSAYLVYQRWDALRGRPVRRTGLGLALLPLGLLLYVLSLSGTIPFGYARPLAMMITLLGLIIALCGLPALRHLWLPWLYLFFAIPIPQRLHFAWTNPLRRVAAEVAAAVLNLIPGLHGERIGSNLRFEYNGVRSDIGVADACSGMRSTITLCALGVAVAFMTDRPRWQRVVLVLACVPIATFCNFIRVTITCWLHVFVDPKYASGQYHMVLGLAIMALAFGLFMGLGWLLDRLVVEEPDDEPAPEASPR